MNKLEKHLHIVTHDVPWPVDYGGVFDLFYKITTLKQLGVHIHLHCFEYGRGRTKRLNEYCDEVYYYSRKRAAAIVHPSLPYIISTRINNDLVERLLKDDHPILLEGIHCTSPLLDDRFAGRNILVRLHNVEYKYYGNLAKYEPSVVKRAYFTRESRLLQKYEKAIANAAQFVAVSRHDKDIYEQDLHAKQVRYLPLFTGSSEISSRPGRGLFCLYHGNLSVVENEKAATWLIEDVLVDLPFPLVIAGRRPSSRLKKVVNRSSNATLVADPTQEEMRKLLQEAQLNLVPSFNSTGIKLKLLNALFEGRHCLVNKAAISDDHLQSVCEVSDEVPDTQNKIRALMDIPFTEAMIEHRRSVLDGIYDNRKNGEELIRLLW